MVTVLLEYNDILTVVFNFTNIILAMHYVGNYAGTIGGSI